MNLKPDVSWIVLFIHVGLSEWRRQNTVALGWLCWLVDTPLEQTTSPYLRWRKALRNEALVGAHKVNVS